MKPPEPRERCPCCGQIKRKTYQRKPEAADKSRENGRKGGRPKKAKEE